MSFALQILFPPFLACLVLTAFLAYLGMHVLAREIIFVDIALAQIAALGTAVAALYGVEPHTHASFVWSLAFAVVGAAVFALTRSLRKRVPQEAFIGIAYAVASAVIILVANALSHGDEEIKEILIGSLLTVTLQDVAFTAAIFAGLAVVHVAFRKPFLALSFDHDAPEHDGPRALWWDFIFYLSFAVVITSSVQFAGVLLVFTFLVVPAVFSSLFATSLLARLGIAWALGIGVSAAGLLGSFQWDLPPGAAVVVTFGLALLGGVVVRLLTRRRGPAARPG